MIYAYHEENTSLTELKAERDRLRHAYDALMTEYQVVRGGMLDAARRAADWRAAYASLSLGTVDAPALHRLLKRLLEENDKLKEELL